MLKEILNECKEIINKEGWELPPSIKVRWTNNYTKDKPFSPSFVNTKTNTIYLMSKIRDKDIAKRLIMHELIHLIDKEHYGHGGRFKVTTDLLNKKYKLNLPHSAEEMLDKKEIFEKNPGLKEQIFSIYSKNSGIPVEKLDKKTVFKKPAAKAISYFNY